MRILHTSDWHIGRTFHKNSTLEALDSVLNALVDRAIEQKVDVLIAAGDIFDTSMPSADAMRVLERTLARLVEERIKLVMTCGNHDSPTRLGVRAEFTRHVGLHVLTEPDKLAQPVTIGDDHGDVHFYGIPFLEPAEMRTQWRHVTPMRSQADAIGHALDQIKTDWDDRGGRAVVIAHTFVAGAEDASADSERDIVGGVQKVPVPRFEPFTYAALGHIHGRATLAENVRYCGAPLHYSFSEEAKPRGGWLVDLGPDGIDEISWLELPVPRPLKTLTGKIEDLLTSDEHREHESSWVRAIITDDARPSNAQRRLFKRFEFLAQVEFRPENVNVSDTRRYSDQRRGLNDFELVNKFLGDVRNGQSATEAESEVLREVILAGDNK